MYIYIYYIYTYPYIIFFFPTVHCCFTLRPVSVKESEFWVGIHNIYIYIYIIDTRLFFWDELVNRRPWTSSSSWTSRSTRVGWESKTGRANGETLPLWTDFRLFFFEVVYVCIYIYRICKIMYIDYIYIYVHIHLKRDVITYFVTMPPNEYHS